MTSVQNLLLLLSGNKIGIVCLICLGLLSSCDLFKPLQVPPSSEEKEKEEELGEIGGGRVYNPETGEFESSDEVLVERMDTIRWRDISTTSYPPIISDGTTSEIDAGVIAEGERGTVYLESYNVGVLLPFFTDRFNAGEENIDRRSLWAIEFYSGAKLALDQLNSEGINLNVSVYDTKADARTTEQLLRTETEFLPNTHLLMGTVRGESAKVVAEYAREKKIPFVSPFSASSNVTEENPYYIQVNPTLATHLEVVTRHLRDNYNTDQIVIVTQNDRSQFDRMQYIQQLNAALAGSSFTPQLEHLTISDDSPNLGKTDLTKFIRTGRETVFFVPLWEDKQFIYAFLRKAFIANQDNPVIVYGMPQWKSFDDVDYNYYENLSVHISSEFYIDPYITDIREFKRRYFDAYGKTPSAESYRGYDDMLYFGRLLNKRGTNFTAFFEEEKTPYFHTKFEFAPVSAEDQKSRRGELPSTERMENKFVHILKFENFYFQPVN